MYPSQFPPYTNHHHHHYHYDAKQPMTIPTSPVPKCSCYYCEQIRNYSHLSPPPTLPQQRFYPDDEFYQQRPTRRESREQSRYNQRDFNGFVEGRKDFFEGLHDDESSEEDEYLNSHRQNYSRRSSNRHQERPRPKYKPNTREREPPPWLIRRWEAERNRDFRTRRAPTLTDNERRVTKGFSHESVSDLEYLKKPKNFRPYKTNGQPAAEGQEKLQSSSRHYLKTAQIVKMRKQEWEKRIINDGRLYNEDAETESQVRTAGAGARIPLPFTTSPSSDSEEIQVIHAPRQEKVEPKEEVVVHSVRSRVQTNEAWIQETAKVHREQDLQRNVTPDIKEQAQEPKAANSGANIKPKYRGSKSLPVKGHFKYPELQELNLSGMRINDSSNNEIKTEQGQKLQDVVRVQVPTQQITRLEVVEHHQHHQTPFPPPPPQPNNVQPQEDRRDYSDKPKEFEKGSREHILAAKHFKKWKSYTKKDMQNEPQPEVKYGFQVLTHSKSHQNVQNYKNLKPERESKSYRSRNSNRRTTTSTANSIASAPPAFTTVTPEAQGQSQTQPKRWYNVFDVVNPWATKPEEVPTAHVIPDTVEEIKGESFVPEVLPAAGAGSQVQSSSSAMDVEFAMEVDGNIQMDHASYYTDPALEKLSRDYDNLIVVQTRRETLNVKKSQLIFNTSIENTQDQSKDQDRSRANSKSKRNPIRTCKVCHESIEDTSEQIMEVKGKRLYWHLSCFTCTECGQQLGIDDHYFHNDKLYCLGHFVQVAHVPQCKKCTKYILDNICTWALGFHWHKDHFQCVHCRKALIGTKFVKCGETTAMCFDCQQKLHSKKCKFCGKKILPTEVYVRSGIYYWHANDTCIKCQTCHRNLRDSSRVFIKNGKTYCNRYCANMYISPAETLSHINPELPQ